MSGFVRLALPERVQTPGAWRPAPLFGVHIQVMSARDTELVVDDAVVLGVTGIVVSGVVGPGVAAWLARRAESGAFHREQVAGRRDELRTVLDEAAGLLASGPTNVRALQENKEDSDDLKRARTWLSEVYPIGQRLQLWLPADHAVVGAYERVRQSLVDMMEAGSAVSAELLLTKFEQERKLFLDASRETLLSPIPESGAPV
jgi:hypothetical protein